MTRSLSLAPAFATPAFAASALAALALTSATDVARADAPYSVEILQEGLERPWAMAFLPGTGDLLITGRTGNLWHWQEGEGLASISGLPQVDSSGQGGLLDVAIDPDFTDNARIWLAWVARVEGGSTTHLGHATLDLEAVQLDDLETVFAAGPGMDSAGHFGARIVFADGHVFMGLGDRNQKDFGPEHVAQRLDSENGAVIRLTLDGEIPEDNPFVGTEGAAPAIWSYGHRNIQAMAVHPETGAVWLAEHGEAGGDEVNIVQRGGNYGWPLASFGVTYRGGQEFAPPHQDGDGFVAPVYHWPAGRTDHFPPSGMAFYQGDAFADWQGHMLIGNLFHQYLGLFQLDGEQVSSPARLLEGRGWRIRDVEIGAHDGLIYVLQDGDNAVLARLSPAE